MGCYNYTCALSQIPVLSGDPVVLLIIAEPGLSRSDRGHLFDPFDEWRPVGFPIYAEYNDYGWIENEEPSPMIEYTLSEINKNLIEVEQGKNPYWDHAVKHGDVTDLDVLHDLLHADRIRFSTPYHKMFGDKPEQLEVSYVMIHRYIFDQFMGDLYTYRGYDMDSRGYKQVTFNDTLKKITTKLQKTVELNRKVKEIEDTQTQEARLLLMEISLESLKDHEFRNYDSQKNFIEENSEHDELFYLEFTKIMCLDAMMYRFNILMHPQLHAGQDIDIKAFQNWTDIKSKQLEIHRKQFDEEDSEDE